MAPVVLYAGNIEKRAAYGEHLPAAAAEAGIEIDLRLDPADADPASVDYLILAPNGPVTDFTPVTRLGGILNLWAGVEAALSL